MSILNIDKLENVRKSTAIRLYGELGQAQLTTDMMLKFIGALYAMDAYKFSRIEMYWEETF